MSTHDSGAGGEDKPRMDWEILRVADAIVKRILCKDASGYDDVVVDLYRAHLERVSERLASRGGFRDARGQVCEAMIWAYFNSGPRRELMRIVATATRSLDEELEGKLSDRADERPTEADPERAGIAAFIVLIQWAASLPRPVGLAVLARARGASYDAVADVVDVRRNTIVKAVGRAVEAAPPEVRAGAGSLLPKRGSRPRGRRDIEVVRQCERLLDAYGRHASEPAGRRCVRHRRQPASIGHDQLTA